MVDPIPRLIRRPAGEGEIATMKIRRGCCKVVLFAAFALSTIGGAEAVAHEAGGARIPAKAQAPPVPVQGDCAVVPAPSPRPGDPARGPGPGKVSARFPNIVLRTQCGTAVRFYDDLVKDRIVIINFMYTTCSDICPGTSQNLEYVYQHLGPRMGRDILMLSISIDPNTDSPARLRAYDEIFGGPRPGWLYLTGDYDEIDALRRGLGVYDLDPIVDADKTQHSGIVTFGNDRTNQWAALPALMDSKGLARTILRITRDRKRKR